MDNDQPTPVGSNKREAAYRKARGLTPVGGIDAASFSMFVTGWDARTADLAPVIEAAKAVDQAIQAQKGPEIRFDRVLACALAALGLSLRDAGELEE